MKKLKILLLALLFNFVMTSCCNSDVIVQTHGAYAYNCTIDEYRVLSENIVLPFLKANKWHTKEEFHKANVDFALEPFEGLAISDEGLSEIIPSEEMSFGMLREFVKEVDFENPQDIMPF